MRMINIIIAVILFMGNAAFAEEKSVEHNLGEGSITRMIKGNEVTIYDWQMLMGDGSKMTSSCIGELSSPKCVADTILACEIWTDRSYEWDDETPGFWHPICDGIFFITSSDYRRPHQFNWPPLGFVPKKIMIEYRIASFKLTAENTKTFRRFGEYRDWEATRNYYSLEARGDIGDTAVVLYKKKCWLKNKSEKEDVTHISKDNYQISSCNYSKGFANTPMAFIRQKKEGGWNILSSHSPPHRPHQNEHWETAADIHKYLVELGAR